MPAYEPPLSLSPSRVSSFTSCPLAFRFASLDNLPEPPSVHTTRGSLVHRALEIFFGTPADERDRDILDAALVTAFDEYRTHPDLVDLGLDAAQMNEFELECRRLVDNYLHMEDPRQINEIGLELRLETTLDSGLTLRGIIDRLELDADGGLVVTDYKTGRAPGANYERTSLASMQFYALLCREVLDRTPSSIRLMYLKSRETITATPTERSLQFLLTRTTAVWRAVERACTTGEFKPNPGPLCRSCAFQRWCPEFGGDPERALIEAPVAFAAARP